MRKLLEAAIRNRGSRLREKRNPRGKYLDVNNHRKINTFLFRQRTNYLKREYFPLNGLFHAMKGQGQTAHHAHALFCN
jgi:hypothetical protein